MRRRGSVFLQAATVALSVAVCVSPALARAAGAPDPLAPAQEALKTGKYAQAYDLYRAAADQRADPVALFTVGLFYQFGWGRPADHAQACQWFRKAADKHVPAGEAFTGDCLREGIFGRPDPQAAMTFYERAVEGGHLISLCSMAELYVRGEGVPRDREKGLALCSRIAGQSSHPAQTQLARLYLEGSPTPQDYDAAWHWLTMAAQGGYAEAQYLLATLYRDGVGRPPQPEAARFWFEEAASRGYLPAYLPTARLYWNAPTDLSTGMRDPAAIAKSYLWAAALIRRTPPPLRQPEAEALLADIRAVMPSTWVPELDRKIEAHLRALAQGAAPDADAGVAPRAAMLAPAAH